MDKREEYSLQVRGVFGRNRKSKFEQFTILDVPAGEKVDMEALKALAMKKIAEVKVKSGRVKICKTPYTMEKVGDFNVKSMEISLMTDNTVLDLGTI